METLVNALEDWTDMDVAAHELAKLVGHGKRRTD